MRGVVLRVPHGARSGAGYDARAEGRNVAKGSLQNGAKRGASGEAKSWRLTAYGCLPCRHCKVDKVRQWCAKGGTVELGQCKFYEPTRGKFE